MARLAAAILLIVFSGPALAGDYEELRAIFIAKEPVQIVFYEAQGKPIRESAPFRIRNFNERTGAFVAYGIGNNDLTGTLRTTRIIISGCNCDMQLTFSAPRTMSGPVRCSHEGSYAELLF